MNTETKNYVSEILTLVRSQASPKILAERLDDYHENDLAEAFAALSAPERQKLTRSLDAGTLSDIFEYLETDRAAAYLSEMDLRKAAAVASHMESEELGHTLKAMPKEKRVLLLSLMDEEARSALSLLAAYDSDEIGSRMSFDFVALKQGLSIKQAMAELIAQAADNDNISTLFVITDDGKFYGAIDLPDLIRAREGEALDQQITTSYPYLYGHELIDDCIETLKDYSEDSIPILDEENHLLGVITSQDIIELVDDEMSEDYARLAGLSAEVDLNEPVRDSVRKRLPWLLVLLGLGMLVSTVVGSFERVVRELPLIMAFQSLILDMAGNVGTQSLAVTIRVLMDEQLSRAQKVRLVGKEVRVGGFNGLLLGVLAFVVLGLYIMLFKARSAAFAFLVSGCIAVSLLVAMMVSSLIGTCVPMFFKKIHVDPAVASGPLITTVNDLVAVVCYYGLSYLLLIETFHL